jgi:hypothetical protein
MKIHSSANTIERGDLPGAERTFRIQNSARAFKVLSRNLYSKLVRAVIRELCCNALDSHIAAGKLDVPFDVHLPNIMEPWFSVTDYGLGMSPDQIENLYTTYFASTKNNTNEQIGGLGLGSKSPFAYADSFTVRSIWNGTGYHYSMYINEAGEPAVTPLGAMPCSDCNGVQVTVPVKQEDFREFQSEASWVLRWFSHKPVVHGVPGFSIPDVETRPELNGDTWSVLVNPLSGYTTMALMGNVLYPINYRALNQKYHNIAQSSWLVINFQIGELDISASREELSYDPVTIEVIQRRLDHVIAGLCNLVHTKLKNCQTLWEAKCAINEFHMDRNWRIILESIPKNTLVWNQVPLEYKRHWYMDNTNSLWSKEFPPPTIRRIGTLYRSEPTRNIAVMSNTIFIVRDCSYAITRCRMAYYEKLQSNQEAYMIESSAEGMLNKGIACDTVKKLLNELGNPEYILASALGKPEKRVSEAKIYAWDGDYSTQYGKAPRKSDNWQPPVSLSTVDGGFYVLIDGLTPVDNNGVELFRFQETLSLASGLGILKEPEVWGMSKTVQAKIADNPKWINLCDWLITQVQDLVKSKDFDKTYLMSKQLRHMSREIMHASRPETSGLWFDAFSAHKGKIGDFVWQWKNTTDVVMQANISTLENIMIKLGIRETPVYTQEQEEGLVNQFRQCMQIYPLLRHALTNIHLREMQDFIQYVKLIDTASVTV